MEIRKLKSGDLDGLFLLVSEVYKENPSSMWFQKKPNMNVFKTLFDMKILRLGSSQIVDNVLVMKNSIIGECEIVKVAEDTGVVGIIVSKKYHGRGLSAKLLGLSEKDVIKIGTKYLIAQISRSNKKAISFFKNVGFLEETGTAGKVNKQVLVLLKKSL